MDRVCDQRRKKLDEIKKALESGDLTADDIDRRLSAAVDAELQKPSDEADMSYVQACQDLLWSLHNTEPYVSTKEESKIAFLRKLDAKKQRKKECWKTAYLLVASAAILVLTLQIDSSLRRGWIAESSTPDEQQYVIKGTSVDSGLIASVNADQMDKPVETITTRDFQKVVDFLGYTPAHPTWLPDGIRPSLYAATSDSVYNTLSIRYVDSQDNTLLSFDVWQFNRAEDVYIPLEQNQHGKTMQIGATEVYTSWNMEWRVWTWRKGLTVYDMFSKLSDADLEQILLNMEE